MLNLKLTNHKKDRSSYLVTCVEILRKSRRRSTNRSVQAADQVITKGLRADKRSQKRAKEIIL